MACNLRSVVLKLCNNGQIYRSDIEAGILLQIFLYLKKHKCLLFISSPLLAWVSFLAYPNLLATKSTVFRRILIIKLMILHIETSDKETAYEIINVVMNSSSQRTCKRCLVATNDNFIHNGYEFIQFYIEQGLSYIHGADICLSRQKIEHGITQFRF